MIVLGADTHKRSHTIAALSATTGELLGEQTVQSGAKGSAPLLTGARSLGAERVWAIEDRRHVSGSLERFPIERGERVLRVHSTLMSASRREARGRGKSDSGRTASRITPSTIMSPIRSHPGSRTEIRLGVRAHPIHTANQPHAPPDPRLDAEDEHR
jgi:hypothetical protein